MTLIIFNLFRDRLFQIYHFLSSIALCRSARRFIRRAALINYRTSCTRVGLSWALGSSSSEFNFNGREKPGKSFVERLKYVHLDSLYARDNRISIESECRASLTINASMRDQCYVIEKIRMLVNLMIRIVITIYTHTREIRSIVRRLLFYVRIHSRIVSALDAMM